LSFSAAVRSRSTQLPLAAMFIGFVLCGMATVLLGPVLPVMSERWRLADAQAGLLFTAQFLGSTLTSILTPWRLRLSLVSGYGLLAAGFITFAFANYTFSVVAFALIGLGIGLSVTATNLLVGSVDAERRATLLTRSNFFWGVGAVVCAPLVGLAVRLHQMRLFLLTAAAALAMIGLVLSPLLIAGDGESAPSKNKRAVNSRHHAFPPVRLFLLFAVILFLYVGAENSVGGWVAVYSHRFLNMPTARASFAALIFWLSLVAGRGIASIVLRRLTETAVLLPAALLAIAGTLLLLLCHGTASVFVAIAVAGLGCGPIFPLLMSRLFACSGTSRHTGWVFAVSGSGGAVLPWFTGLISTQTGSLRVGFAVPLAALAVILLFVLFGERTDQCRETAY
jgi:MFS transporter, FHS family, glucose/mannose:H+ symporter